MKLFVWHDALRDYTAGVMFALAENVEEARALIRKADPVVDEDDLAPQPTVYDRSVGVAVWGGG